jgi:hypothetical protein
LGGPVLLTKVLPVVLLVVCAACGSSSVPDAGSNLPLSAEFAGTWGGPAVAVFSVSGSRTGSFTYDAALVVATSGTTASITGVCPDGTGSRAVTGSGTSASSSGVFLPGTLGCPAIVIANCPTVLFTYLRADMTLTGPTTLNVTATGSARGCGNMVDVTTTFDLTLAAAGDSPVPQWDLRFKGVGSSFIDRAGFGLGGGVAPGTGEVFSWAGRGQLGWGLVAGGGFVVGALYDAAQTAIYRNTLWALGAQCPEYLSQVLAANNVITAMDGDPHLENASCILLGVAQPDAGPTFQYLSEDAVPVSHILDQVTSSARGRSFVVTALFQVDAGLYSYIAESVGPLPDGGYEAFDTVIQTPLVTELATAAEDLADAGYVITASAWQGEPNYLLVGTRATGSTAAHATRTVMTDDLAYPGDVQAMLKDGYVPVSLLQDYYPLADGGLGSDTWLIGEK